MELNVGAIINNKWKVEKLFEESGQGQSALVSSVCELEKEYVIKCLKDIKNTNSVKRFRQETKLLNKLQDIERVPCVIEENEEQYYYVMEYVKGTSLESAIHIKSNKCKFDKAMTAIMQLLGIVKEYSERGILHRDIKPANIICVDGNINDLYLIDFGIGHDKDDVEDLTEINVQLGNRFLRLPELQNGNKRDLRSDITMCVGILFFLLTGSAPISLIDEAERMPHQTEKGIRSLQWVGTKNLEILNRVFDKGFQNNIKERYQRVDDLIFALNEVNLHSVSTESRRKNFRKTDSFCLATIKDIVEVKPYSEESIIRRLKLYDGQLIAIGNVNFSEVENKRFIHLTAFNLFEIIDKYTKYRCANIEGLFVKKKEYVEEILMKDDAPFELSGKIHFRDNIVEFDSFMLQNVFYEIPVKRFFAPDKRFEFGENIDDIICNKHNIIILGDSGYGVCNFYEEGNCEFEKIELTYLLQNCHSYKISESLKWIAYFDDKVINIAKYEGRYVRKVLNSIDLMKGDIIDYAFVGDRLLLLQKNRLLLADLEEDTIEVIYNVNKLETVFGKLKKIHHICLEEQVLIIKNQQDKKIIIDLRKKEKIDETYNHIIISTDKKYIYSADYDKIVREKLEDGEKEVVCNINESNVRGFYMNEQLKELEYVSHDYYFSLVNEKDDLKQRRKKVRIFRIEDNSLVRICDIGDAVGIEGFWVCSRGMVTINKNNDVTLWKMYN